MTAKLNLILLSLCTALLSSCMMAQFDRVPGERLSQIPEQWRGTYKQIGSTEYKTDSEDSTRVILGDNWWELHRTDTTERYYMGDSIALSTLQHLYFISVRSPSRKFWYVLVAEISADGKVQVRPIVPQVGCYKLRKKMKRVHDTGTDVVYSMNETELLRYYRKAIRKKPAFELVKEK